MRYAHAPGLLIIALLLQGCAALGVTGGAVALAAMGEGAGAVVKAGTEYRLGGVAYRTFTVPLDRLHEATRATLTRMDLELQSEQSTAKGRETVATARQRTINVRLEPLTRSTTRMRLAVKRDLLRSDRATASEIIAQTERTLDEASALAREAAPSAPACCERRCGPPR
jgi:hypothetical protein